MTGKTNPMSDGPPADIAIQKLKTGNSRFASGNPGHPNSGQVRREEVCEIDRRPFATILSCSDSRVPPELIFDQGIGDLFVVRTAGNVCDILEIATVEFGVAGLKTPLLLILGHTECAAVTAAATGKTLPGHGDSLIDKITPAVRDAKAKRPGLEGDELVLAALTEHVWHTIRILTESSSVIRDFVRTSEIAVRGAIYDL